MLCSYFKYIIRILFVVFIFVRMLKGVNFNLFEFILVTIVSCRLFYSNLYLVVLFSSIFILLLFSLSILFYYFISSFFVLGSRPIWVQGPIFFWGPIWPFCRLSAQPRQAHDSIPAYQTYALPNRPLAFIFFPPHVHGWSPCRVVCFAD